MTRKYKLIGVLMAVVAMFAVSASSASAEITSNTYPVTPHASSTGDIFDAFGSTVKCTENTFTIHEYNVTPKAPVTGPTTTVTATPTYKKCTAFGLPATVNFTGCDYVFHNEPTFTDIKSDLVCPVGVAGVDITVYTTAAHANPAICHVVVKPFVGKAGLQIHNDHPGLILTGTVEGIEATQVRNSIACPAGTETNTAKYTVQPGGVTITATGDTLSVS